MSTMLLAVIATMALVAAKHFMPWMGLFRKGLPGLIIFGMNLASVIVPFSLLILDWGKLQAIRTPGVVASPWAWLTGLWILAATALGMELICYGVDAYIERRLTWEADRDENESLKADLTQDKANVEG